MRPITIASSVVLLIAAHRLEKQRAESRRAERSFREAASRNRSLLGGAIVYGRIEVEGGVGTRFHNVTVVNDYPRTFGWSGYRTYTGDPRNVTNFGHYPGAQTYPLTIRDVRDMSIERLSVRTGSPWGDGLTDVGQTFTAPLTALAAREDQ